MNFAVDTGGTFTDLIVDTGGDLRMFKSPTTPEDPTEGVLDVFGVATEAMGIERPELLAAGSFLVHGTTHAINALITGATAAPRFSPRVAIPTSCFSAREAVAIRLTSPFPTPSRSCLGP